MASPLFYELLLQAHDREHAVLHKCDELFHQVDRLGKPWFTRDVSRLGSLARSLHQAQAEFDAALDAAALRTRARRRRGPPSICPQCQSEHCPAAQPLLIPAGAIAVLLSGGPAPEGFEFEEGPE